MAELDHVVIHIDDWQACTRFYTSVLDADVLPNPEGSGNPLGSVVYRIGNQQLNVHGPWPGNEGRCCEAPYNTIGGLDLAFVTERDASENADLLRSLGIDITAGPMARFGAQGWGESVYCQDPSGNGIELISYAEADKS